MAEQRKNTRNTKSTKVQPVNDYGRIQPQAPELEEAVLGALMIDSENRLRDKKSEKRLVFHFDTDSFIFFG